MPHVVQFEHFTSNDINFKKMTSYSYIYHVQAVLWSKPRNRDCSGHYHMRKRTDCEDTFGLGIR